MIVLVSFCSLLSLTVSNVFIVVALYTERQLSKVSRAALLTFKHRSTVDFNSSVKFGALCSSQEGLFLLKLCDWATL